LGRSPTWLVLAGWGRQKAEVDQFDIVEGLVIRGGTDVFVLNGISLHGGLAVSWPGPALTAKSVVERLTEHSRKVGLRMGADVFEVGLFKPRTLRLPGTQNLRCCPVSGTVRRYSAQGHGSGAAPSLLSSGHIGPSNSVAIGMSDSPVVRCVNTRPQAPTSNVCQLCPWSHMPAPLTLFGHLQLLSRPKRLFAAQHMTFATPAFAPVELLAMGGFAGARRVDAAPRRRGGIEEHAEKTSECRAH